MLSLSEFFNQTVQYLSQPTDNFVVLFTGAVTLAAAIYTVKSSYQHTRLHQRREKTSVFIQSFSSNDIYHCNALSIKSYLKTEKTKLSKYRFSDLAINGSHPRYNHEAINAIRNCLNLWERAAIDCRLGIYDSLVLYDNYGTHFISMYKALKPVIKILRERDSNNRVYLNAEWLAISWITRRAEHKKIHDKMIKRFIEQTEIAESAHLHNTDKEALKLYKQAHKITSKIITEIYKSD